MRIQSLLTRGQVSAKHINSLVELIMTNIDKIHAFDFGANTPGAASGLIEGAGHPDAVLRHFQSILASMVRRARFLT
jgi:vacuolar protein sorting-associated protein 35